MIKQLNQVKEFHEKFGIHIGTDLGDIDGFTATLRASLIAEEAKEVNIAIWNEPIENITKELCDLLYVTYGTILAYGLQNKIEDCFNEVHKSNMSKLGRDGKPVYREDGKLLKGDNYSQADIKSILEGNV